MVCDHVRVNELQHKRFAAHPRHATSASAISEKSGRKYPRTGRIHVGSVRQRVTIRASTGMTKPTLPDGADKIQWMHAPILA